MPDLLKANPRIVVIGVGGAGGNAVNNMVAAGLTGIEFVVANTDTQALAASKAEHRIQLGSKLTDGLGAGSKPEIGEAAAEEALEEIHARMRGAHMVFIAAGMGGGTGTGAAYVFARAAKELGILTIAIVTKPFQFEGSQRMRNARPVWPRCGPTSIRCSSYPMRISSASRRTGRRLPRRFSSPIRCSTRGLPASSI